MAFWPPPTVSPYGLRQRVASTFGGLILFLASTGYSPRSYAQMDVAQLEVEVHEYRVTLTVEDARLEDVIRRIGEEAGFETVVKRPLDTTVTTSLRDRPLDAALRELAREVILIVEYTSGEPGEGARQIIEVKLYPSSTGTASSVDVEAATDSIDPALLERISSDDRRVRITAIQSLGRLQDDSALVPLEDILIRDDDALVRRHAAAAVGSIGSERAVPLLKQALDDPDQAVRVQSVNSLGRVGGERAIQILGDVLLNDADQRVRQAAAWSLGRLDDETARAYLEAAAKDPDEILRKTVNQSLGGWEEGLRLDSE